MKITVLDLKNIGKDLDLASLAALGDLTLYDTSAPSEIPARIADCEVIVMNKIKLTGAVLASAKNLKLICIAATGYDNIDVGYCREKGIAVCNVAGYSTESVVQMTVAAVLSLAGRLETYRKSVASGAYSAGDSAVLLEPVYHELAGKTWGIVGYGTIGKRVGDVARALGCRVVACKRTPAPGVECLPLAELCRISDVITVHTPLTPETRGMISEEMLSLMKPGVILGNFARGAVTDEKAVASAMESGKIAAFAADVYSAEPMPASHPFFAIRDRENVLLTPHMFWAAAEARRRCLDEIVLNIKAFLAGETRNRVDL